MCFQSLPQTPAGSLSASKAGGSSGGGAAGGGGGGMVNGGGGGHHPDSGAINAEAHVSSMCVWVWEPKCCTPGLMAIPSDFLLLEMEMFTFDTLIAACNWKKSFSRRSRV